MNQEPRKPNQSVPALPLILHLVCLAGAAYLIAGMLGCASIILPDGTKVTAVGTSTKITYGSSTNNVGAASDVEVPPEVWEQIGK